MGGTALGASGRSNNGLKLDVKTGKLSLWRLFPTFTFTFYPAFVTFAHMIGHYPHLHLHIRGWQAGQMAACLRSPAAVPAAAQAERTGKILLLCLGLPGSLCLDLLERSHP